MKRKDGDNNSGSDAEPPSSGNDSDGDYLAIPWLLLLFPERCGSLRFLITDVFGSESGEKYIQEECFGVGSAAQPCYNGASKKPQLSPGENVWVNVDILMTHDVCGPASIGIFRKEFGQNAKVWDCEKLVIIPDHYIFTADKRANRYVDILRDFCMEQNIKYFYDIKDLGNFKANPDYKGVCHIALAQEGHCRPGEMEERMTLCNMVVEAGGKNGVVLADSTTYKYLEDKTSKPYEAVYSDGQARFFSECIFGISKLEPLVAKPHSPDNRALARECKDVKIDMYIGSCTGGTLRILWQLQKLS